MRFVARIENPTFEKLLRRSSTKVCMHTLYTYLRLIKYQISYYSKRAGFPFIFAYNLFYYAHTQLVTYMYKCI